MRLTVQQKKVICINKKEALKKRAAAKKATGARNRATAWDIRPADFSATETLSASERDRASFLARRAQGPPPAAEAVIPASPAGPTESNCSPSKRNKRYHPNCNLPGFTGDPFIYESPTVPMKRARRHHSCEQQGLNHADDLDDHSAHPDASSSGATVATSAEPVRNLWAEMIEAEHNVAAAQSFSRQAGAMQDREDASYKPVHRRRSVEQQDNIEELLELKAAGFKVALPSTDEPRGRRTTHGISSNNWHGGGPTLPGETGPATRADEGATSTDLPSQSATPDDRQSFCHLDDVAIRDLIDLEELGGRPNWPAGLARNIAVALLKARAAQRALAASTGTQRCAPSTDAPT
jgi:hypothetical protein